MSIPKSKGPLEKEIEKKVCDYARKKGFYVRKFTSPCARAVPDRLFIRQGVAFFIEFKRLGEEPTPAQKIEHKQLREVGAHVAVVDNVAEGLKVIDWFLNKPVGEPTSFDLF